MTPRRLAPEWQPAQDDKPVWSGAGSEAAGRGGQESGSGKCCSIRQAVGLRAGSAAPALVRRLNCLEESSTSCGIGRVKRAVAAVP